MNKLFTQKFRRTWLQFSTGSCFTFNNYSNSHHKGQHTSQVLIILAYSGRKHRKSLFLELCDSLNSPSTSCKPASLFHSFLSIIYAYLLYIYIYNINHFYKLSFTCLSSTYLSIYFSIIYQSIIYFSTMYISLCIYHLIFIVYLLTESIIYYAAIIYLSLFVKHNFGEEILLCYLSLPQLLYIIQIYHSLMIILYHLLSSRAFWHVPQCHI